MRQVIARIPTSAAKLILMLILGIPLIVFDTKTIHSALAFVCRTYTPCRRLIRHIRN